MFKNEKIECVQNWMGKELCFDPDSSPKAWEHYKKYYVETDSKWCLRKNYNFNNLFFYKYEKVKPLNGYYTNLPLKNKNRLFALENNTKIENYNGIDYCKPANRLSGECDFNFNENKIKLFKEIIGDNKCALEQLEKCKNNHHRLVNFSLIQAMGDMQGFKGRIRFDRFDTFIFRLDQYFSGLSTEILSSSSEPNKPLLKAFLNNFKDIYEYCKAIYFIKDKEFIDEIIKQGKLPIKKCEDVVRYMNLAQKFWNKKESHFLEN